MVLFPKIFIKIYIFLGGAPTSICLFFSTFCPSVCISEKYIIWSWFLTHMCKMWYPEEFFIFLNFDFWGSKRVRNSSKWKGKKVKNGPKWEKSFVCRTPYLRNHTSYDCHLRYTSVKWWCLQAFVTFFKNSDFFGF